jgi:hypothetical protein
VRSLTRYFPGPIRHFTDRRINVFLRTWDMEDLYFEVLMAQLNQAARAFCDEAEMLKIQLEHMRLASAQGEGYRRVEDQKMAEAEALERYIQARQEMFAYIERLAKAPAPEIERASLSLSLS